MTTGVNFLCCVALLVLVTCAAATTSIKFLPTLYVTGAPERPISGQVVVYAATVCDSQLYQGNMTIVRVNMPHGWDPVIGYVAKMEACNNMDCETVHCTNWPDDKFSGDHFCNFTYDAKMGDIFVRVTAGPAPNIDWTVAVEFLTTKTWVRPQPVSRSMTEKYYNYANWPMPKPTNGFKYAQVVTLMQIVLTAEQQKVQTRGIQEYFLQFCPDSGTGERYDVTVTAIAVDSKSAMSTYVCLPKELPCTTLSSHHYDSRGVGINSITLTTSNKGLSNLHVLVVGWGDGEQTNTFELGATIKKMN